MPSLQSRLLVAYLRLSRRKRPYTEPDVLRGRIEKERTTVNAAPPAAITASVHVERRNIEGSACYTLWPRGSASGGRRAKGSGSGGGDQHVVYLHGGCYVFEITPHHWQFCAGLATRLGCKVTVPIYPLAPEHGVDDALQMVLSTYRQLAQDAEHTALMGDSAGGGMALALAQLLRDADLRKPDDVVLLSPWVDATMTNPDIAAIDLRDPWLSPAGLIEAGKMYARGADPKTDARVSPLHGDLKGLGRLSIFIGSRDVLLPDARLLRDLATGAGTTVRWFEYAGMVHDFMLIDLLPEAKQARDDIDGILLAR